jgi:hypothetical protein
VFAAPLEDDPEVVVHERAVAAGSNDRAKGRFRALETAGR